MQDTAINGVFRAALEISERRAQTLAQLKEAREQGDTERVLILVDELCGIDDEQKSHRVDTSVN
jgi:hypothetical protein